MSSHAVEKIASLSYQMGQMQVHIDGLTKQLEQAAQRSVVDQNALKELQGIVTAATAANADLLKQLREGKGLLP